MGDREGGRESGGLGGRWELKRKDMKESFMCEDGD